MRIRVHLGFMSLLYHDGGQRPTAFCLEPETSAEGPDVIGTGVCGIGLCLADLTDQLDVLPHRDRDPNAQRALIQFHYPFMAVILKREISQKPAKIISGLQLNGCVTVQTLWVHLPLIRQTLQGRALLIGLQLQRVGRTKLRAGSAIFKQMNLPTTGPACAQEKAALILRVPR